MVAWTQFKAFLTWLAGGQSRQRNDALRLAAARPRPAAVPPSAGEAAGGTGHALDAQRDAERRRRKLRARTSHAFAPSQPVDSREDLCGRDRELQRLLGAVCDSHLHGIIFGPRGSGKTSLARVFGDHADERGFTVIYLSCTGSESFSTLMTAYVEELGATAFDMSEEELDEILEACHRYALTPRSLTTLLERVTEPVVFILDEFDRVTDPGVKEEAAALAKLLSDMRSHVRLLFVGISGDIEDLIGAHQSVRRHLVAVGVTPLVDEAVDAFIAYASRTSGMSFSDDARKIVSFVAQGSPYHVRLFCLHGALAALDRHCTTVGGEHMIAGMRAAREDWRMTNEKDAQLFERLAVADGLPDGLLVALVRTAARQPDFRVEEFRDLAVQGGFSEAEAAQLLHLVEPALDQLAGPRPASCFRDALAPQFLLASRVIAREPIQSVIHEDLAGSL